MLATFAQFEASESTVTGSFAVTVTLWLTRETVGLV